MQINGVDYTIGADPEVFIGKNDEFVSVHDMIPGTKAKPFPVQKGGVQVDGMAAEFNIDPASSLEEFQQNLSTVQSALKDMIGEDHDFLHTSTVTFDEEFIKHVPAENLRLGCEPDFNAWTGFENRKPAEATLMRTAGGHVHIGGFDTLNAHDFDHYLRCERLTRILDESLGVYSLHWDDDDQRRGLYGAAGAFRPKIYGMEYRTLSNKWVFNRSLISFVYRSVREALEKWSDESYEPDPVVEQIINTSDRDHVFFKDNPRMNELMG